MSRKRLSLFLGAPLAALVVALLGALLLSAVSVQQLRARHFSSAARWAGLAAPIVRSFDILIAYQSADLHIWSVALQAIAHTPNFIDAVATAQQTTDGAYFQIGPLVEPLAQAQTWVHEINLALPHTLIVRRLISPTHQVQLSAIDTILTDAVPVTQELSTGEHLVLVFFQNHHELRATGGFMGSYALIDLTDGRVTSLAIEDIYDADGQFAGFVAAPPGVREYLSNNRGLRLPDANWNPDFAQTAQAALSYFPPRVQERVDVVGAVTLELGQALLEITGPINLPDYQLQATAENLPTILGGHRDDFFPGSIQKKQALSYLLTNVRLRLVDLTAEQWLQVHRAAIKAAHRKSLQLYSTNATLQQIFEKNHVTGQLGQPGSDLFYLVESNVGINKVNQYTSRAVRLNLSDYRLLAEISFDHRPPTATDSSRLAYINYQRLFVPASWQVKEITISGQPLREWDERELTANQQALKEIGFLVPIVAYEDKKVSIELTKSLASSPGERKPLYLQKQPGVPPTSYSIVQDVTSQNFLLDSDIKIEP